MADDERYRLDALDFLLCTDELALEVSLLVFYVAFLNVEELEVARKLLVFGIQILFLELFVEGGLFGDDRLKSGLLENICISCASEM